MKTIHLTPLLAALTIAFAATLDATERPLFKTEEILDEGTLDIKILQDWYPIGATRQKLIEINVAEWWPGQDYRILVRISCHSKARRRDLALPGPTVTMSR